MDSSNPYGFAFNISTQILTNYVNGSRSSGVYSIPDCALTLQVGPYVVTYTGLISKTPTAFHIDWLRNKMHIRLVKRSGGKKKHYQQQELRVITQLTSGFDPKSHSHRIYIGDFKGNCPLIRLK